MYNQPSYQDGRASQISIYKDSEQPQNQQVYSKPIDFMSNVQDYTYSEIKRQNYRKPSPKPKQEKEKTKTQVPEKQESKKQTNKEVEQGKEFTDHSILNRQNRPNNSKFRSFSFYNLVPWEKNYTNSGDQFRDIDEETRATRDYTRSQSWWMLPFYYDYFINYTN